uniref:Uncharacterized protein n=1 Tax=Timema monikensis TaxID=170555 RepID=A0A7R9DX12_9NEOP|nr:unnamed protein product [Timema monikensis]
MVERVDSQRWSSLPPYHENTAENMVERVDSQWWSYHGPQKGEAMTVYGRQTMYNSAERSQENEMDSEMELEYIIKVKEKLEMRERELRRLYEAKKKVNSDTRKKIAHVSPLVSTNKTHETTRSYSTRKLSAAKEFIKRDGTTSNQGLMYEFKLAALIFFRLVKNATPFHMCTNLEGADLFDDIVFKFEPKGAVPSTTTTVFMQLKHKQKSSKSEAKPINFSLFRSNNGGITLMRFFKSFSQIEEKISAGKSDIIFNSDLDSCEFVIYTNTKIRHDLFVNKVGTLSEVENLLKTGGYIFLFREKLIHEIEAYKTFIDRVTELTKSNNPTTIFELISFEAEKLRGVIRNKELFNRVDRIKTTSDISDLKVIYDIIEEVKDLDISKFKRFVKKIKVFTCQCNEEEASKVIRQDLQKVLSIPDPYDEIMFVRLMNSLKNWWQNGSRYLTENTKMWQDVVRESDMILFDIRLNKLREMGLVFKEEMLKECQEQLRDECGIVSIVSYSVWPTLTCLKVCQALGSTEENGVLLIQFRDLEKMGNRIWQRWRDGYRRTVVLDNVTMQRTELPNLQDLKLNVGSIVMEHPELSFLIIWKAGDPLRYELQTEEDRYIEIQDYSSFDDLHRSSQEKLERATVTETAVGSLEPPEKTAEIDPQLVKIGVPVKQIKKDDVKRLLQLHYCEDWENLPDLHFYRDIISSELVRHYG